MFNLVSKELLQKIIEIPYPNGCILTAAASTKIHGGRFITGEILCEKGGDKFKCWHSWSINRKGEIVDNHLKYFELFGYKVIEYFPDREVTLYALDNCPSGQLKRFLVQWFHNQEILEEIYESKNMKLLNDFVNQMNGDIVKENQPT